MHRFRFFVAVVLAAGVSAGEGRRPGGEEELRFWLENMITHHAYSMEEVREATGLSVEEIRAAMNRFGIRGFDAGRVSARAEDGRLKVLPYPGGRHPRIGFLEGAIDPQRETKFSVFLPWDAGSYVVVDVPEAIWSNLGLTYLAHTHIDTIWSREKVSLPKLEWERGGAGELKARRRLPNGIEFGVEVAAETNHVAMRLWLKNGTEKTLTDLRVQNCVMLKRARGFEAQTNSNKVLREAEGIVAARAEGKTNRWIVTTWAPLHRVWANAPVPCIHADPKLPDAGPGETVEARGKLWFFEGEDLEGSIEAISRGD